MCTSPQNIYLPRGGIRTTSGTASYAAVVEALLAAVQAVTGVPGRAASLLGAIQAESTLAIQQGVTTQAAASGRVLRRAAAYDHPDYPRARTRTPMIAKIDPEAGPAAERLCAEQQFGPNAFILPVPDAATGLARGQV